MVSQMPYMLSSMLSKAIEVVSQAMIEPGEA